MRRHEDLSACLDRTAGLLLDAACELQASRARGLPYPHRRLIQTAQGHLDSAQQALFQARNAPWQTERPTARQLELL